MGLYLLFLLMILYRMYGWIRYEMIMWYVLPDLQYLTVDQNDVKAFKDYYNYIKVDCDRLRDVLQDIFGRDVTNVILYQPDYIHLYHSIT